MKGLPKPKPLIEIGTDQVATWSARLPDDALDCADVRAALLEKARWKSRRLQAPLDR
ncbi:hypothetical protein AB5J49_46380 [Streptomyces sp. R28]|uniref:Uncharacterized protein n=1 Tax=Streptomyces sp. R28 TaxID=3238628 RepID=A0AB39QCQ9_9ACTN